MDYFVLKATYGDQPYHDVLLWTGLGTYCGCIMYLYNYHSLSLLLANGTLTVWYTFA